MKNRKVHLELIRVIACFLVIVNHTNSQIFISLHPSITWFGSLAYFFISKIAVPLFVMTSGAVLINKKESYQNLLKKRVLRTLIVLIAFSFFYYCVGVANNGSFDLLFFLYSIYTQPITNAYWYLYMYLGLLVMLPIIRKLATNMPPNDYIYYFVLWSIFTGVLPVISEFFEIGRYFASFELPIISVFMGYFIIGDWIENKLDISILKKRHLTLMGLLSIMCIIISVKYTYCKYIDTGEINYFMDNTSLITVMVPSITIFTLAKYVCSKIELSEVIKNTICFIGKSTFVVYLTSDYFIAKLAPIYNNLNTVVNPLIAVFIYEIAIFLAGFITSLALRKIRIVRNFI